MANIFKTTFFLLIFLLNPFNQTYSGVRFEHINIKDGLSQNHVTRILKDSKGFMWFCTQNSLNRYDGKSFKIYKHISDDSTSLSNDQVQDILEDNDGNLWIGTFGGGLNKFDSKTEKFTHYRHDPANNNTISSDFVLSVYEDKSGFLWIGTNGSGINKFNKNKETFIHYSTDPEDPNTLSNNIIRAFYEDESGILWIGTDGGGLNEFDKKVGKFTCYKHDPDNPKSLSHDFVLSIIEDEAGALWLATGGGLNKFYKDSKTFAHYRHDPNDPNRHRYAGLQNLFKSSTEPGVIWITSPNGIDKFEINKEKFTHYKHDPYNPASLSTNNTISIYEDVSGLLWIGTADKGLNKYIEAHEKINHYKKDPTKSNSLSGNSISSIYEDKLGIIWIGTDGDGLNKLDRNRNVFTHYKYQPDNLNSLSNNKVYSIIEKRPGILWIGTFRGLNRFDIKNNKFTIYKADPQNPQSLSHNHVSSIYIDQSGNIWIGTLGGGLNKHIKYENDNKSPLFLHYQHDPNNPHSISDNSVLTIYEDNKGFLWIGTMGGGLNKFDKKEEKFYSYKHDPNNPNSISNNLVSTIYQDKNGVLWIGTEGGGLNRLVPSDKEEFPPTFVQYRQIDGLSNDFVYGILEDKHHNLWLSTKNGLSKFNPDAVDDKGIAIPSAFRNYYAYDGFQDNEFTFGSNFKNSKGEMFLGGPNGFNAFYPDSLKENLTIPPVVITDFKVLNKNYDLDTSITEIDKIILSHNENFFSFEFAVLDYIAPEKNNYAYKLDGLDNDWNYMDNRNFAHYTNLSPGKYVFRVKGSNNNGIWNEEGTSIRIIITPPWWKSWWAYASYVCLLFGLIYFVRRYELNRQYLKHSWKLKQMEADKFQEIDRMKSRFFANISHEFRTPLTLIKGPVQQMLSKDFKGNIEKQYQMILRNTNRLMQLINQLLDLSKLESGQMKLRTSPEDIIPLIKGLAQSFESLANQRNITLQFQSYENKIIAYIDRDKFEKIIVNLLSNAFKFTPEGGKIIVDFGMPKVELKTNSKITTISISNSGPGIPAERLDKVFDRFYKADESYTKDSEGTGIGLALTKELIELHHGEIKVKSEPGKGTTFTIHLPLGKKHLLTEEIIPEPTEISSKTELDSIKFEPLVSSETKFETASCQRVKDSPTLLIVEDNPDMRDYMRGCLESCYRIREAENGEKGIQQALRYSPDLIISDVMMPKMDGFQFCAKIKTDERTSHIPVILLTAKASGESKIVGLETGADDYLTKPFDTRELQVRIKNLIEQRRQLQEKFRRGIIVQPSDITVTSIDEQLLKRAIKAVETNISDPTFDTMAMAKEVGMSRMLLHTKLKALTGQSTGEFIRTLRLKRAAQLLQQGYGNVSQVAFDVGFQNLSHFAKTFRKQFGQSPSHYTSKSMNNSS